MEQHITDERTGLKYGLVGDYYLPELDIPEEEKIPVNRYGKLHGRYLKQHDRITYDRLFFSGKLNRYLAGLGRQAEEMLERLIRQYAEAEHVNEKMKAENQLGWVRAMNSIRNRAEEVVLSELVYC